MKVLARTLLTLVVIAGAASAGITLFCLIFGYSIILFSTGSMHPTIPKGSLSLVKSISAEDIRIGDVVTVDRPDEPPLTHRVVELRAGAASGERIIRMKGDANQNPDFDEYTVTSVRKNVFSIPGGAEPFLAVFDSPMLTVAAFGGVASLVLWSLWPVRGGRHRDSESRKAHPQFVALDELLRQETPDIAGQVGQTSHT